MKEKAKKGSVVFILVLFLLICSTITFASVTQTTLLYPTDSVHFQGYNIYIQANVDYTILRVEIDDHVAFINTGLTSTQMFDLVNSNGRHIYEPRPRIIHGPLKIYLNEICADITRPNCARPNPRNIWIEPGFELTFVLEKSDISVIRSLSKSHVWLQEPSRFTATVENTGTLPLFDFELRESFPSQILVSNAQDWRLDNGEHVFKISSLQPGEKKTAFLDLALLAPSEFTLRGSYSYISNQQTSTGLSNTVFLGMQNPYTMTFTVDKPYYDVGDTGKGTISIEPSLSSFMRSLPFDMQLVLPLGLEILSTNLKKDSFNNLLLSETLSGKKTFDFTFTSTQEGAFDILLVTNATGGVRFPVRVQEKTIIFGDPETITSLSPEDISFTIRFDDVHLLEGESTRAEVFIKPGSSLSFSDVSFTLQSTTNNTILSKDDFFIGDLTSRNRNHFFSVTPLIRNNTRPEEITLFGTFSYVKDNERFTRNASASKILMVYQPSDAIVVTRSVNPNPVAQNETAVVMVEVENKLSSRTFDIFAVDIVPDHVLHKSVRNSAEVLLLGGEKRLLYSYQIRMPFYVPNSTIITTRVLGENISFEEETELLFFVTLKRPSLQFEYSFSPLIMGRNSQLQVTVTNTGDLPLRSVSLNAPLFQNIALISERDFFIPSLEPLEGATLFFDYYVKRDRKETSFIDQIVSIDTYGNVFRLSDEDVSTETIARNPQGFCGLISTLSADSRSEDSFALLLEIDNYCDEPLDFISRNPSLLITIPPFESRKTQFSKTLIGDSFEGISYSYMKNGVRHLARSNSLDLSSVPLDSSSDQRTDTSSSGSSGSSGVTPPQGTSLEDPFSSSSLLRNFFGIIGILFVVFLLMGLLLKLVSRKKNVTETDSLEEDEVTLVPPSIKEGIDAVDMFVVASLKVGIPLIEIEEQLHYAGWSKEIIDAALSRHVDSTETGDVK